MLILTRKAGEKLMIGNKTTITVLGVKGNQIRIGVNAPKNVEVHREEIYQRIQKGKDAATRRSSPASPSTPCSVTKATGHWTPRRKASSCR